MSRSAARPWPQIERSAVIDRLTSDIRSKGRRGVILCGEPGIGKSSVATRIADRLSVPALTVRGNDVVSDVNFGALAGVLAGATDFAHPGHVATALADVVERTGSGGSVVVIVDNAALVDSASASLLAQFSDRIQLVIVAGVVGDVPEPLLELWRDGLFLVHDVEPFSLDEVGELLIRHLGGPVAQPAIELLWRASTGNPLFLQYLVAEQLDTESLVQHDGVWVLARHASIQGQQLVDLLRARLDRWSEGERFVLELAALADGIPFALLEQLVAMEDIARLLDDGVIEVGGTSTASVRVKHPLVADVVRSSVSFVRRRQLRDQVVKLDDGSLTATTDGVIAYASWTLASGVPLEPQHALRAAQAANDLHDPEYALRLASTVSDSAHMPAAAVQKARAWRMLGQHEHVAAVLAAITPDVEGLLDPEVRVGLAAELSASAQYSTTLEPDARRMLQAAVDRVRDSASELSDEHRAVLLERLDIARWELEAGLGNFAQLMEELEASAVLPDSGPVSDRHLAAVSLLAETYTLTGRHDDAIALLDQAAQAASRSAASRSVRDLSYAACFTASLRLGLLDRALSIVGQRREELDRQLLFHGSIVDTAAGTVHLMRGRAADALPHLYGAQAQQRIHDVRSHRGQVLAGLAYASALLGDAEAAARYLAEYDEGTPSTWNTTSTAQHLALAAKAIVWDRDEVVAEMLATANAQRDAGLVMEELLLLGAAARLGSEPALERITKHQLIQPGPLARIVVDWASAVMAQDVDALLVCATNLAAQEHVLFAHEVATRAVEIDPGNKRASAVQRELATRLQLEVDTSVSALDLLTRRERDVASRAASGMTNRDIAAELYLSVRTVESYLQSAYGKVGVRTRSELAELVGS